MYINISISSSSKNEIFHTIFSLFMAKILLLLATIHLAFMADAAPLQRGERVSSTSKRFGTFPVSDELQRSADIKPNKSYLFLTEDFLISLEDWKKSVMARNIDFALGRVHAQLTQYFKNGTFNAKLFLEEAAWFEEELGEIEDTYHELSGFRKELHGKLRYVQRLCSVMGEASKHLMNAAPAGDLFHEVMARMYNLRLLILMLFDLNGNADVNCPYYIQKVAKLEQQLKEFGEENYRLISRSPPLVIVSVWDQYNKADRALKVLITRARLLQKMRGEGQ